MIILNWIYNPIENDRMCADAGLVKKRDILGIVPTQYLQKDVSDHTYLTHTSIHARNIRVSEYESQAGE